MDNERSDATQDQFSSDAVQGEASQSGYPEEQPSSAVPEDTEGGGEQTLNRAGNPPLDEGDSPAGASGEGSQATGHPENAG